jgi:replicative DNA helicase
MNKEKEIMANKTEESRRLPPFDQEAEMALLGALLVDDRAVGKITSIMDRERACWFYVPSHQVLFGCILDMKCANLDPTDTVLLVHELRRRSQLEFVGDVEYLKRLAKCATKPYNVEFYARIVRDAGRLRDIIRACGEIICLCYDVAAPEDVVSFARDCLDLLSKGIPWALRETSLEKPSEVMESQG